MERDTSNVKRTYAGAGVNRDAAQRAIDLIKKQAHTTLRPEVLNSIGAFAGLFRLSGYKDPILASSVDGVGTKVKIALALDRHDTIGLDLVNHCVNDIFTCGAQPLFFLDYIAMGKLIPERVESIVSGLSQGCRDADCALIGGETAEMPGMYAPGDYDLVGFIVGVVEKERVLKNSSILSGDALLALPSSGLHTNGYSLVRKVFNLNDTSAVSMDEFYPELGRTLGEELLEVHRCYYNRIKPVLYSGEGQRIKGMAHITGGGIIENVARILPEGLAAHFRLGSWSVPPIFSLIQERGIIEQPEMYRVFNMGIGMVLICSTNDIDEIVSAIPEATLVGEVKERGGKEQVVLA